MNYSTQTLFAANVEDMLPEEDEIDELFANLLHVEPPVTLIKNILATVAMLPLPQHMNAMTWDDIEALSSQNSAQKLS